MEDKPLVPDAEARARRWSDLPARVKLEDTFPVQPIRRPLPLPDLQESERIRAIASGAAS